MNGQLICGAGFSLMAWREAIRRCGGHHYDQLHRYEPTERENTLAESGMYPVSEEFYRILDRAYTAFHGDRCLTWTGVIYL